MNPPRSFRQSIIVTGNHNGAVKIASGLMFLSSSEYEDLLTLLP